MKTVRSVRPTWKRGIYSCDFVYELGATANVSERELPSVEAARAYYDGLATRLGKTRQVLVGEEAFATANGSFVVRSRNKVLVVDVSKLPVDFASRNGRADYAQTLAEIILNEWDPM
jgi:hypothetical protein